MPKARLRVSVPVASGGWPPVQGRAARVVCFGWHEGSAEPREVAQAPEARVKWVAEEPRSFSAGQL